MGDMESGGCVQSSDFFNWKATNARVVGVFKSSDFLIGRPRIHGWWVCSRAVTSRIGRPRMHGWWVCLESRLLTLDGHESEELPASVERD